MIRPYSWTPFRTLGNSILPTRQRKRMLPANKLFSPKQNPSRALDRLPNVLTVVQLTKLAFDVLATLFSHKLVSTAEYLRHLLRHFGTQLTIIGIALGHP